MPKITPDIAKNLLHYDPETGKLYWKARGQEHFPTGRGKNIWNGRFAGKEAFTCKSAKGQLTGAIYKTPVFAHRIAWMIAHNEIPDQIDHINGDVGDNRLCNLRNVSSKENMKNRSRYANSKMEVMGVYYTPDQKWRAVIQGMHLGTYWTKDEAIAARKAGEICMGYHENHGRDKAGPK